MSLTHKLVQTQSGVSRLSRSGLGIVAFLVVGVGGWATFQSIQDAVLAPGTVIVNSQHKLIQHQDGGTVAALNVAEGDHVAAGAVIARLDAKILLTELDQARRRIFELSARRWRLVGERDGLEILPEWKSPIEVSQDADHVELSDIVAGQKRLFETKRLVLSKQKQQLRERIKQLDEQITGLSGQLTANRRQLEVTQMELKALLTLKDKGLLPMARRTPVERQEAALVGEVGGTQAQIATARGQIAETEMKLLEADEGFRKEALDDLQLVEGELSQLVEKRGGLEEKLNRLDIRAPASGRVHDLVVHTVGGVIKPGDTIANIVPDKDPLVIEAYVATRDIDRLTKGTPARIRFSAFNSKTTPELAGHVASISADQIIRAQNTPPIFKVRISLDEGEVKRLQGQTILPGMEAEVLITSAERTVASYLAKPRTDQFNRAFRER